MMHANTSFFKTIFSINNEKDFVRFSFSYLYLIEYNIFLNLKAMLFHHECRIQYNFVFITSSSLLLFILLLVRCLPTRRFPKFWISSSSRFYEQAYFLLQSSAERYLCWSQDICKSRAWSSNDPLFLTYCIPHDCFSLLYHKSRIL